MPLIVCTGTRIYGSFAKVLLYLYNAFFTGLRGRFYFGGGVACYCYKSRAVYPHSFFADPDTAVFLNADPDPGSSCFLKNEDPGPAVPAPVKSFLQLKKTKKIAQK